MPESKKGTLYLVPVPISDNSEWVFSPEIQQVLQTAEMIVCERIRTTRRHIKKHLSQEQFDKIMFYELDKHDVKKIPMECLNELASGKDVLLFSEAGSPCIADPGYLLVKAAHREGIRVHPFVGPSSILLALMASGSQAQYFEFHGYLPKERSALSKKLMYMEQQILRFGRTQVFMETPYKNARLFDLISKNIKANLRLCVAISVNGPGERILSKSLNEWRREANPFSDKEPAIFVLGAG